MIDEPVQNACGSLRKLNSTVDQRIHSSAQVLEVLGDHRQGEGELQDEIAVAGGVEAVGGDGVEAQPPGDVVAIDRQAGSGQGRRAEAEDVGPPAAVGQPEPVALEFFAIGQPVVRRQAPAAPAAGGCSRAGSRRSRRRSGRQTPAGVPSADLSTRSIAWRTQRRRSVET